MTRSTPTIHDALLSVEGEAISIGSVQWFAWLERETTTIFSFHNQQGSYTARKEHAGNHRGAWYWKAYRTYRGKLYRAYLGKGEELTLARLDEVAQTLAARIHDREQQEHVTTGSQSGLPHHQDHMELPMAPLLETKLCPPRLPAFLVERSYLLTLLDAAQNQKLTLLHAPAGFGKTTL